MIWREVPPTAGLPPRVRDLFGGFSGAEELTGAIAAFLEVDEIQLECSGTACLLIAFEYLKALSSRRTIIIPGYTCPLVVRAAQRAGLKVVACDLARGSFALDLERLEALIDRDTVAVIATHYGGALIDVERLRTLIEGIDPEIAVIEDAAQSFGSAWNGRPVGMRGRIGLFSFAAGKGFTLYEGGCLVGETPAIRKGLRAASERLIRSSFSFELRRSLELAGYHLFYNPAGLALTYGWPKRRRLARGDELRAAGDWFGEAIPLHPVGRWRRGVGAKALARYRDHLQRTQMRFHHVRARLREECPTLDVHDPALGQTPIGTFVFVTFPSEKSCRCALAQLWPEGHGVGKLFLSAIGDYSYLAGAVAGVTPNAAALAARTLTVSTSEHLGEDDLSAIVAGFRTALSKDPNTSSQR